MIESRVSDLQNWLVEQSLTDFDLWAVIAEYCRRIDADMGTHEVPGLIDPIHVYAVK